MRSKVRILASSIRDQTRISSPIPCILRVTTAPEMRRLQVPRASQTELLSSFSLEVNSKHSSAVAVVGASSPALYWLTTPGSLLHLKAGSHRSAPHAGIHDSWR